MPTQSTLTLFAEYQQCCLDHLSEHGLAAARTCRCGGSWPCPIETRWVQMLETVVGGVAA
jgi:hypothetical protein